MRSACEPRAWPAYGKLGVKPPLNHVPRDEGSIKDRVKAASTQHTQMLKSNKAAAGRQGSSWQLGKAKR